MTCKDCLHYEACDHLAVNYNIMQVRTCVCKYFSDKAEWVNPPCKVGDTVYCLIAQGRFGTVYTTGEAIARVVSKIIWDGNRFEIYSDRPHYWDNGYSECNFYGYWGDSVFATKEAAEAQLKKLREKK